MELNSQNINTQSPTTEKGGSGGGGLLFFSALLGLTAIGYAIYQNETEKPVAVDFTGTLERVKQFFHTL